MLDFDMNYCDALNDFATREGRTDIRCRTVLINPLEHVLDGATGFGTLTVAGNGCRGMKSLTLAAHPVTLAIRIINQFEGNYMHVQTLRTLSRYR